MPHSLGQIPAALPLGSSLQQHVGLCSAPRPCWRHNRAEKGMENPPFYSSAVKLCSQSPPQPWEWNPTPVTPVHLLFAKREVLGLCSFEQPVKKRWLLGAHRRLVSPPALLTVFREQCPVMSQKLQVLPSRTRKLQELLHAAIDLLFSAWLMRDGPAPLESFQFENSKTEKKLRSCIWKPSRNHRQLHDFRPSGAFPILNHVLADRFCLIHCIKPCDCTFFLFCLADVNLL